MTTNNENQDSNINELNIQNNSESKPDKNETIKTDTPSNSVQSEANEQNPVNKGNIQNPDRPKFNKTNRIPRPIIKRPEIIKPVKKIQDEKVQPNQNREKTNNTYTKNYPNKPNFYNKVSLKKFSFKKLTVLIPLFEEEESLKILYSEIVKTLKTINIQFEILFIDDGSRDNSLKIIKEIAGRDNRVRYVSFRNNYGKSAAMQVGFRNVTGDVVVTMDADLQDDPAEIPNLLAKLDEGYDLVSGWKKKRYDPFIKKHSSKFFNYMTSLSSGIRLHDFNCGLKIYRRDVIDSINIYGDLHRYIPVLAKWQGFKKITEIPVLHHPRKFGKTKFGISRFFNGFVDLLTVTFITRFVKRPMHLFGLLGIFSFLIGFAINGYLTYHWFFVSKGLQNRPLLFLGVLLIILGVQFFSTGLIGELIAHNSQTEKEYSIKDRN